MNFVITNKHSLSMLFHLFLLLTTNSSLCTWQSFIPWLIYKPLITSTFSVPPYPVYLFFFISSLKSIFSHYNYFRYMPLLACFCWLHVEIKNKPWLKPAFNLFCAFSTVQLNVARRKHRTLFKLASLRIYLYSSTSSEPIHSYTLWD